ncbi:unnamed protein product [Rhodiola kirilowii]
MLNHARSGLNEKRRDEGWLNGQRLKRMPFLSAGVNEEVNVKKVRCDHIGERDGALTTPARMAAATTARGRRRQRKEEELLSQSEVIEKGMEGEDVEDSQSSSSDSFINDSGDEDPSIPERDETLNLEEPMTEEEVEELISDFLEVEGKAAEAQETLEEESLAKVESDVREELAQTLSGYELEKAVEMEMKTFREEWENVLDELESESSHLLEQLDGAGIELPKLYKWIESQAPNGCCTEAWKKRTHWMGSQVTTDITETVVDAEKYLENHRPVRRRHGKLLEEGASGFLNKRLTASEVSGGVGVSETAEVDWSSINKLFSGASTLDGTTFGSKHWATVYLASTPQQAAAMGLEFPGVHEVEEIEDVDVNSIDPLLATALANENELDLSEEQKKNFKKVKEEDDAKIDRVLQLRLKHRRQKKRSQPESYGGIPAAESPTLRDDLRPSFSKRSCEDDDKIHDRNKIECYNVETGQLESFETCRKDVPVSNGTSSPILSGQKGLKRPLNDDQSTSVKRSCPTVIIDSDDDSVEAENKCVSSNSNGVKLDDQSLLPENDGDSIGMDTSHEDNYYCTSCGKAAVQVHSHPILKVVVCEICIRILEIKFRKKIEKRSHGNVISTSIVIDLVNPAYLKDPDSSVCYCRWCGRNSDLLCCKSCKKLFCTMCIKRNFGEDFLAKVQQFGWDCCCCTPTLLEPLTKLLKKAIHSGDIIESTSSSSSNSSSSSDSESDKSDKETRAAVRSKKRSKKRIRRILDDTELGEETKRKIAIEKERQERLKSLQKPFSKVSAMSTSGTCDTLPEGASAEVLGDAGTGYIVNVVREQGEDAVRVPPSISAKLKVHQIAGIRFMWENIVQSIGKLKSGDKGLGCILAHTMGLGKTFQVIAFLYTAMRSIDLGLKTALIVTPVNVIHNWRQEFLKWRPSEVKPLRVYMLEDVSRERRAELLGKWRAKGGVFLIGYSSFRNLSLGKYMKDRHSFKEVCSALQDGPDILVCDEAHVIKNTRADVTQALKQVKCQRRVALTGSPLQNNLMEYYCMVDFVREGFLGSSHEFKNRFQNPIENGQHANATSIDVKIMNQRSHILYEQLKGFVQRMDMSVAKKDLPPKTVFVIAVKLSNLQRRLYKRFLEVHGFTGDKLSNEKIRKSFFAGYQALAQICNHPGILQRTKEDACTMGREDMESFLPDDSSGDENMDYNAEEKLVNKSSGFVEKKCNVFLQQDWWHDILLGKNCEDVDFGGKMVLLLDILTMCSKVGDKALIFSQSIPTLDLIERYLSKIPRVEKKRKLWKKGVDWYRIDGKTAPSERQKLVEMFNDPVNKRVKCALISTRAGSLGINLYAANRVVIMDGSWNPTYDLQAIYRAWRYGQKKPVFAYRFVAYGTMEEKIYKRQVIKEGLSARVVDKQQVHRTMSKEEMLHLFDFGDDDNSSIFPEMVQENGHVSEVNPLNQKWSGSHGSCSSDKLMGDLLGRHFPRWVVNYHEHETLLQENEEERLSKEEQDMAWEVYKRSLEWEETGRMHIPDPPVPDPAPEHRPPKPVAVQTSSRILQPNFRLRGLGVQRKCTTLSHLLTLRSQGTKIGCSTICGECAQVISRDSLQA